MDDDIEVLFNQLESQLFGQDADTGDALLTARRLVRRLEEIEQDRE